VAYFTKELFFNLLARKPVSWENFQIVRKSFSRRFLDISLFLNLLETLHSGLCWYGTHCIPPVGTVRETLEKNFPFFSLELGPV
jgi:hypothetical protein